MLGPGQAWGRVQQKGPYLEKFLQSDFLGEMHGGLGCGVIFTSYGARDSIQYSVLYETTPYSIHYFD